MEITQRLTSDLVLLVIMESERDHGRSISCIRELFRRFALLEAGEEVYSDFFESELRMKVQWEKSPGIMNQFYLSREKAYLGLKAMNLPNPNDLLVSELIMIIDEARAYIKNKGPKALSCHEQRIIWHILGENSIGDLQPWSIYFVEFQKRLRQIGFLDWQIEAWRCNEEAQLHTVRWKLSPLPFWTEESVQAFKK